MLSVVVIGNDNLSHSGFYTIFCWILRNRENHFYSDTTFFRVNKCLQIQNFLNYFFLDMLQELVSPESRSTLHECL